MLYPIYMRYLILWLNNTIFDHCKLFTGGLLCSFDSYILCLLSGLLPLYILIASGLSFIFFCSSLMSLSISNSGFFSLEKNIRSQNLVSQHAFCYWVSQSRTLRDFSLALGSGLCIGSAIVNSSVESAWGVHTYYCTDFNQMVIKLALGVIDGFTIWYDRKSQSLAIISCIVIQVMKWSTIETKNGNNAWESVSRKSHSENQKEVNSYKKHPLVP